MPWQHRDHNYVPTVWEDRVIDEETGDVLVPGTPVNEDNMNNMEAGILAAHLDVGGTTIQAMIMLRAILEELDRNRRQRCLQGQETIVGGGGDGYFRSEPFVTVALPAGALPQLNAPNYNVLVVPISASDWGRIGELIVYDKAQNGFKVRMTGSAESVTFMWTILNPTAR